MVISCVCPTCEGKFRVRDGSSGRGINCPHCGSGVTLGKTARPVENRVVQKPAQGPSSVDSYHTRPKRRSKHAHSEFGVVFWTVGGLFLFLALVSGGVGIYLLTKGKPEKPTATTATSVPVEQPQLPPQAPAVSAAFLDIRANVHAGEDWYREVKLTTGGSISFRITSEGPFSVSVVTEKAYKALVAKKRGGYGRNEVLLVADASMIHEGYVTLPTGNSYFIIRNNMARLSHCRLQCYVQ